MRFPVSRIRFTPALIPTVAAFLAVALTGYLGFWQQGRAAEKKGLQAEFDARAGESPVEISASTRDATLRYRQGWAEGEWLVSEQIYLDNKVSHEIAGYHVITPLKLADTNSYLLVNRGWLARGSTYPVPPTIDAPPGRIRVSGLLSLPSTRFLELSSQPIQGKVWQNLTPERYRKTTQLDVLPFVLLAQTSFPPLEAVTERPDARADKHTEYMLTWYSLAVTVIALWVGLNIKLAESDAVGPRNAADAADPANCRGTES